MTNIVFRLADIPEYSNVTNSQYIKDIDMYMGKINRMKSFSLCRN